MARIIRCTECGEEVDYVLVQLTLARQVEQTATDEHEIEVLYEDGGLRLEEEPKPSDNYYIEWEDDDPSPAEEKEGADRVFQCVNCYSEANSLDELYEVETDEQKAAREEQAEADQLLIVKAQVEQAERTLRQLKQAELELVLKKEVA